jgi:tRNA-dihydrouridine synthase
MVGPSWWCWLLLFLLVVHHDNNGRHRKGGGAAAALSSSSSSSSPSSSYKKNDPGWDTRELFSVAPMMAHTHRHYHYLFRQISRRAHLYTEMIPATQICQAYDMALTKRQEANPSSSNWSSPSSSSSSSSSSSKRRSKDYYHPEQVLELVHDLRQHPYDCDVLDELLRFADEEGEDEEERQQQYYARGHIALQLGGRDPYLLRKAAAIGVAYGYSSINLNCGCPSTSVSGRSSGVALMLEPEHVAHCLEHISHGVEEMATVIRSSSLSSSSSSSSKLWLTTPAISVKHRLGVARMDTYNAQEDHAKSDDEALQNCREFVRLVTLGGSVSRIHVHARIGLLPMTTAAGGSDDEPNGEELSSSSSTPLLWVPPSSLQVQAMDHELLQSSSFSSSVSSSPLQLPKKINHKRAQYKAKQRARAATISNRSVPPLRPNVVSALAMEFPTLEFVTNGGIQSLSDIRQRGVASQSSSYPNDGGGGGGSGTVVGAMVGRAVINHPCAFASVDSVLWGEDNDEHDATSTLESRRSRSRPCYRPPSATTRNQVLQAYMAYCQREEARIHAAALSHTLPFGLEAARQRMVGAAFHMFVGEDGNAAYQRRLRQLVSRAHRHSVPSMVQAALLEAPESSRDKQLTDHVPLQEIRANQESSRNQHSELATKRSGRFQTSIY